MVGTRSNMSSSLSNSLDSATVKRARGMPEATSVCSCVWFLAGKWTRTALSFNYTRGNGGGKEYFWKRLGISWLFFGFGRVSFLPSSSSYCASLPVVPPSLLFSQVRLKVKEHSSKSEGDVCCFRYFYFLRLDY